MSADIRVSRVWTEIASYGFTVWIFPFFAICAVYEGAFAAAAKSAAIGVVWYAIWVFAKRQSLGWIIDDNGERQKVELWSRGHAVFTPTTYSQRILREATKNQERRKALLWNALGTAILGAGIAWCLTKYYADKSQDELLDAVYLLALCELVPFAQFLNALVVEIIYQSGFQDMDGAKVLDKAPIQPGYEQVAGQKVHGDARLATQDEALDLLK